MIILVQRAPRPDAVVWRGRRLVAAMDAIVWPAVWVAIAFAAPLRGGVLGLTVIACALLSAVGRLQTAVLHNERYRFTISRWGKPILVIVVAGGLTKVALTLAAI